MFSLIRKYRLRKLPPKIVGLMPARNEGAKIQFALKALAQHTDAIIYLDDCSIDDTLAQVEECRAECRVERILTKDRWVRDEPADRNRLLQAGREIGGTHFIVIDADEALTSNFLQGGLLKDRILELAPGDQLALRWIHLWRGVDAFRTDGDKGTSRFKYCIFCDDRRGVYSSDFIHTSRVPRVKGKKHRLEGPFGLLHFQFVDWDNLVLKQNWYRWLERVYQPDRPIGEILKRYLQSEDETGLVTEPCPPEWFETYPFLDPAVFHQPDNWRIQQMKEWEAEKGTGYFAGLS
jgi:glycosyltransferase involved in cell wall biosynthesis